MSNTTIPTVLTPRLAGLVEKVPGSLVVNCGDYGTYSLAPEDREKAMGKLGARVHIRLLTGTNVAKIVEWVDEEGEVRREKLKHPLDDKGTMGGTKTDGKVRKGSIHYNRLGGTITHEVIDSETKERFAINRESCLKAMDEFREKQQQAKRDGATVFNLPYQFFSSGQDVLYTLDNEGKAQIIFDEDKSHL